MKISAGTIEDTMPDIHQMLHRRAATWVTPQQAQVHNPQVTVLMSQSVYLVCMHHALSDLSRELGGYIVGRTATYKGHRYIYAEHAIAAPHTLANEVRLTFTTESQLDINDRQEFYFGDKRVVGWYHTHPEMSVFYSGDDMFLHTNFFKFHHFQFGLVLAPKSTKQSHFLGLSRTQSVSTTAGFFVWQQDNSGKYYIDPANFVGCVELSDIQGEPMFQWENMSQQEDQNSFPTSPSTVE